MYCPDLEGFWGCQRQLPSCGWLEGHRWQPVLFTPFRGPHYNFGAPELRPTAGRPAEGGQGCL